MTTWADIADAEDRLYTSEEADEVEDIVKKYMLPF